METSGRRKTKRRIKLFVVLAVCLTAPAAVALFFVSRPPVLIVTDTPFVALYGTKHLWRQRWSASAALFRPVKPVMVADGAGPDVVTFAIAESSPRPYCVLFPRYHTMAAQRFHSQFPEVPAVVFNGYNPASELSVPNVSLCVYSTDRETDLYRAGLCSGILGAMRPQTPRQPVETAENNNAPDPARGTYVLWQDRLMQTVDRDFFFRGVRERNPDAVIVFIRTAAEMPDEKRVACTVLAGTGAEYLEKNPAMPLVLFSWLNPSFTSRNVAVIFDDSPWALTVPAVQMAIKKQLNGKIPSKPLILSRKIADNAISRLLKEASKKDL